MEVIRLPLRSIWDAPRYDHAKLPVVDTFDDDPSAVAYYEERGWDKYHPVNHQVVMLPEFGPARYFYGLWEPIARIASVNFRIRVESDDIHEPYEPDGKTLVLEPTDEPESVPNGSRPDFCTRGGYDVHLFGQPDYIQNAAYPADPDGGCCRNLITLQNEWGDLGNWNILVGVDDDGLPNVAYFEASCH